MPFRYIFIDFDSFYASVEQQINPSLRGLPTAVVPTLKADTTCCIATSYEAKKFGVKTGVSVKDARKMCPNIRFVEAKHDNYVKTHKLMVQTIHEIVFIKKVCSIDEMYGVLPPKWQTKAIAIQKAKEIKIALKKRLGDQITASIGISSNPFIAKLGSKIKKPNGLVLIKPNEIPKTLNCLELNDITGIGKRMLLRLKRIHIHTFMDLYNSSRNELKGAWGSIEGERMWFALKGLDLPESPTTKRTIGHSHVLPPKLRTTDGGFSTLHRMLEKATQRLRAKDYFAGGMAVYTKFDYSFPWYEEIKCEHTQDTLVLSKLLNLLWEARPYPFKSPTKVSITLKRLIHASNYTPSLFSQKADKKRLNLLKTMDLIKELYGNRSIYYANAMLAQKSQDSAPMRIAFTHIPDLKIESDKKF